MVFWYSSPQQASCLVLSTGSETSIGVGRTGRMLSFLSSRILSPAITRLRELLVPGGVQRGLHTRLCNTPIVNRQTSTGSMPQHLHEKNQESAPRDQKARLTRASERSCRS
jgi:hypothetical protein